MANIRDVSDVPYLVSNVQQVPEKQVERDSRPGMTQVGIAINSRTADIHPYMILVNGDKSPFTGQCVVQR